MRLLARSVRGIEWLLAAEIRAQGAAVSSIGHRVVEFSVAGEPSDGQLRLGCADDVFLFVGELRGVDHRRASLATLTQATARMPLGQTLATLSSLRAAPLGWQFTVVASFLGARNYNRYEAEAAVAESITKATGLSYESSREGSPGRPVLTFRVHLVEDAASLSLRVFEEPLHRRRYKQRSYPGTLHPPLARAMALLAGLGTNATVLDPFCGVGTLLLEARLLEHSAQCHGVDIDAGRLSAARENAELAGVSINLVGGDAAQLPFEGSTFERVLTNLPWGVAVEPEGALKQGSGLFWTELARVLRSDGRAIVLTDPKTALAAAVRESELSLLLRFRVSLFGQYPELWVLGARDAINARERSPIVRAARFGHELSESLPFAEPLSLDFGAET
ncbi:MAG TPA: methyltransferase domain-containing protein [Polyangiaceae bacterium]|nr:methyltransferase domain-containing protein [Polyangiaceae bacterium]